MNAKWLIAAVFALPVAAYAGGDKASSTSSTASASASSDGSAMFKDLDKNNDGFISREEAKGSPHEKAFDQLDKNRDGKLSREEHAAAHKAQASSGSTQSGEKKY
jgi:Ca2+-binding EF-hand superfamily protein